MLLANMHPTVLLRSLPGNTPRNLAQVPVADHHSVRVDPDRGTPFDSGHMGGTER
jgi:hypothetical protein